MTIKRKESILNCSDERNVITCFMQLACKNGGDAVKLENVQFVSHDSNYIDGQKECFWTQFISKKILINSSIHQFGQVPQQVIDVLDSNR